MQIFKRLYDLFSVNKILLIGTKILIINTIYRYNLIGLDKALYDLQNSKYTDINSTNSWNRSNNIFKIEVLRTRIDCLKFFFIANK
jgi:hypothetical protein